MVQEPILAIVFDFDGTLVKSAIDFTSMKQKVFSRLINIGVNERFLNWEETIAFNLKNVREKMLQANKSSLLDEIDQVVEEALLESELESVNGTKLIHGVPETINVLKDKGFRIGVLTRGSRRYLKMACQIAGLQLMLFDGVICRDDFPHEEAKPNGIALRRMAMKLGIHPSQCLLVGDHQIDYLCAIDAGASFVGVLTGAFNIEQWSGVGCMTVINSVVDLPALLDILMRKNAELLK